MRKFSSSPINQLHNKKKDYCCDWMKNSVKREKFSKIFKTQILNAKLTPKKILTVFFIIFFSLCKLHNLHKHTQTLYKKWKNSLNNLLFSCFFFWLYNNEDLSIIMMDNLSISMAKLLVCVCVDPENEKERNREGEKNSPKVTQWWWWWCA